MIKWLWYDVFAYVFMSLNLDRPSVVEDLGRDSPQYNMAAEEECLGFRLGLDFTFLLTSRKPLRDIYQLQGLKQPTNLFLPFH